MTYLGICESAAFVAQPGVDYSDFQHVPFVDRIPTSAQFPTGGTDEERWPADMTSDEAERLLAGVSTTGINGGFAQYGQLDQENRRLLRAWTYSDDGLVFGAANPQDTIQALLELAGQMKACMCAMNNQIDWGFYNIGPNYKEFPPGEYEPLQLAFDAMDGILLTFCGSLQPSLYPILDTPGHTIFTELGTMAIAKGQQLGIPVNFIVGPRRFEGLTDPTSVMTPTPVYVDIIEQLYALGPDAITYWEAEAYIVRLQNPGWTNQQVEDQVAINMNIGLGVIRDVVLG